MAAKTSETAELNETNFKCVHCQEQLRQPCQLPCGHRVCRDCSQVLLSSEATETCVGFRCPSGEDDCEPFTKDTVYRDRAAERELESLKVSKDRRKALASDQQCDDKVGRLKQSALQNDNLQFQGGRGRERQLSILQGRGQWKANASLYEYYQSFKMGHGLPHDLRSCIKFLLQVLGERRPEMAVCLLYSGVIAHIVAIDCEVVLGTLFCCSSRRERIIEIVVRDIMRCCRTERGLSSLTRAVISGSRADIVDMLHARPLSVFELDESGRNAFFWALIGKNQVVMELLMNHFMEVKKRRLLDQASMSDCLRICLMSLTFAYPAIVEKIFEFVRQAVGNAIEFHKLISDGHALYSDQYNGINFRSEGRGYLLLHIVISGNHHAAECLLKNGVDVGIVDPVTNQTVLALALDCCKGRDSKMLKVLMSAQSRN